MKTRIRFKAYRRENVFAVVPTLLTLGNTICGFGSITFATKVGPGVMEDNDLVIAALLIVAAMVFDMLDGRAARLTHQTSLFGAQLDSLSDAISFGVAPAFIMLKFPLVRELYHPRLLWVIAVFYVICAVLRLARFNVETDESDSHQFFSGLPTPAAAGLVASFAIALPGLPQAVDWPLRAMAFILPMAVFGTSCLMVSRIRYPHVFNQVFRGRRSFQHLLQLVFALVVVLLVPELAVAMIFGYFVLGSPVRALWSRGPGRRFAAGAVDGSESTHPAP